MIILNWEEIAYGETNSPIGDPAIDISQGHYLVFQIDLTDPANTGSITLYAYLSIDGVNFDTVPYTLGTAADTEVYTARQAFSAHSVKFKAEATEEGTVAKPIVRCYVNDVEEAALPSEPAVKLIDYMGDAEATRSFSGLEFTPSFIALDYQGYPCKRADSSGCVVYDESIPGWRATQEGEHLIIDSDGFTVQSEPCGNASGVHYTARCYR